MRKLGAICLPFLALLSSLRAEERPFVQGHMMGQLGNQMFIVAAVSACAWDHNADPFFPGLQMQNAGPPQSLGRNLKHIFFRCPLSMPPSPSTELYQEPCFQYKQLPYKSGRGYLGFFQTEKYFAHHRDKILKLFAPLPEDKEYIEKNYPWLLKHPKTVGVHLRKYFEDPHGNKHIQYGKDYLKKAMNLFDKDALFVIFSNDIAFAKVNTPEEMRDRVKYSENQPHYIDLRLLSLCKHNIVTNSSFGWWGAWLNENPEKKVIAPSVWFHPKEKLDASDIAPSTWTVIDAKWGGVAHPQQYM